MKIKNDRKNIEFSLKQLNTPVDIELEHGDRVRLACPANEGKTCMYLEVSSNGKLYIEGGSSIIEEIVGKGMKEKVSE